MYKMSVEVSIFTIHPICNRFKSDRDLDEVRADLFE